MPSTAAPSRARRWFAFLGGAVAWVVHLFGVYLISEFGCVGALGSRQWLNASAVAWLLLGITLVPLFVAVAATIVGCRDAGREPQSHAAWLSRAGWMFSVLFAITIAVEAIPALFYLRGC